MGLGIWQTHAWIPPILILIGLCLSTTHYRLFVDFSSKVYRENIWILGFTLGKRNPYDLAVYFYLTSVKYSNEYGSLAPRYYVDEYKTQLYLKLDENIKLFVAEGAIKRKMLKKASDLSKVFNLEVIDNTV